MGQIHRRNFSLGASLDKNCGIEQHDEPLGKFESLDHIPKYISSTGLERITYNH
jgi:hypothetical protein